METSHKKQYKTNCHATYILLKDEIRKWDDYAEWDIIILYDERVQPIPIPTF